MSTWIAVLAVGLGSYLIRVVPLVVTRAADPGPRVQRLLGYAGVAAITALIATSLRHHTDATGWLDGTAALAATLVATILSWRGRAFLTAVAAALAVYVVLAGATRALW